MTDNRPYHREVYGNGPCETCGADRGHPCRTKRGGPAGRPHKGRIAAYEAALFVTRAEAERRQAIAGAPSVARNLIADLIPDRPMVLCEVPVSIIDSALHVRGVNLITTDAGADADARDWCSRQTDALFYRYLIDGREVTGFPTRDGIEWKETEPA